MLSRVAMGPRWGSAKPSSMVSLLLSCVVVRGGSVSGWPPGRAARRPARGTRAAGAGAARGAGRRPARPGERGGRSGDEHLVAAVLRAGGRQLLEVEHLAEQ